MTWPVAMAQVNATKIQKRMRRPRTAAQQAADVVEHVLSIGGEDFLETAEHLSSWWQLAMVDVYLALFVVVAAVVALSSGLVWLLLHCGWQTMRQMGNNYTKQKMT